MTPKERAAMQLALEALVDSDDGGGLRYTEVQAVAALREVLAEPDIEEMTLTQIAARHEQAEQEPVAWKDMAFARLGVVRDKMRPEDVEIVQRFLDGDYAAPVRTKDLTDDEIAAIVREAALGSAINRDGSTSHRIARAVIAADREKNK